MSALTDAVTRLQAARQAQKAALTAFKAADRAADQAVTNLHIADDEVRIAKQALIDLIDPPEAP